MLPNSRNDEAWKYIEKRFGIQRNNLEYDLKKSSGDYWLTSKNLSTDLKVETNGLRAVRETGRGLKPTTYFLQVLQNEIKKNVVELDRNEFLKLLKREEMVDREMQNKGYVALKYEGKIVGCGFYMGEKVSSRIPKGRSRELADIIEKDV